MSRAMLEDAHQSALFDWVERVQSRYPDLAWLYAIPNGGFRHAATAGKLKAQGVKAGVPDLFLPSARGEYHGLYIEMKRPAGADSRAGVTSAVQLKWIAHLRAQGYRVDLAYGWEQAAELLKAYLS